MTQTRYDGRAFGIASTARFRYVERAYPTGNTMKRLPRFLLLTLALLLFPASPPASADSPGPRILPAGQLPDDSRLGEPVTLHDYHPLRPVETAEQWPVRSQEIRRQVMVGSGLWPMPEKTPLNTVIHSRKDMGDYTVENVYFESLPGHFVCGNLYRPAGASLEVGLSKDGKRPAVLCPHGHWKDARFFDVDEAARKQLFAIGAERFDSGARNHIQARCVQLARMGCVVFHYDMLGNSDSMQFLEHRRGPRGHMSNPELGKWGFVSPQAAARLQTNFGLQTWNSERALDFVSGLDEVDVARILVTGASGGATQTMMIAAIDDRVAASFPAVMVSTAMQGGCTCENTHYLRIGQGNIDIAAAVAPRPQEITAADDWTIDLKEKGYPQLKSVYDLIGAGKNFDAHFDVHFKHNYNHVSRTHMYNFVNRHFKLGLPAPVLEREFEVLLKDDLTVFDDEHPAPSGDQVGDAHERAVCRWWTEDARRQIDPLLHPADKAQWEKSREVLGGAVAVMIGRVLPAASEVNFGLEGKIERNGFLELTGLIGNDSHGEEIPAAFLHPTEWNGRTVIWLSNKGKAGLFDDNGTPTEQVMKLVHAGNSVVGLDLFKQGEFLNEGEVVTENQRVAYPGKKADDDTGWRESSVYRYGYNHPLFSQRVHDVLTATAFVRNHETWKVEELALVGLGDMGAIAAAARAVAGDVIDLAFVETEGFRFADLASDWDQHFVPGAAKYGDVAGFLTQSAPRSLWIADNDKQLQTNLTATWKTAGKPDAVTFHNGKTSPTEAVVAALLQ